MDNNTDIAQKRSLTPRELGFVKLWLDKKVNQYSDATCYEIAGYRAKTGGAKEAAASRLLRKPYIRDYLTKKVVELEARVVEEILWDRQRVVDRFEHIADKADDTGDLHAEIKAVDFIGKIIGVYEKDNSQKMPDLANLLAGVQGMIGVISIADSR